MTEQKKTRASKKSTVKAVGATVKPAVPAPAPPSNEPTTRAVADIPAEEGFLGKYSSKGRQKDDPKR